MATVSYVSGAPRDQLISRCAKATNGVGNAGIVFSGAASVTIGPGGEHRAEQVPPELDGLVADVDPALGQEIFDVSKRQWVSDVHHHNQTDDLWRAIEISERIARAPRLTQPRQPESLP